MGGKRHTHGRKDIRDLVNRIETWDGWRVENRSITYIAFPPDGQKPISIPHGPRGTQTSRALLNIRAALRRAGAPL